MACVWAFLSGKGGTGKSTVALCAAAGLAAEGLSTVLVDADAGVRNLDLMLGLENKVVFALLDVVEEEATLAQALIAVKEAPGLSLICAAQTREPQAMKGEAFHKIIEMLSRRFAHVVIDCPTGIGPLVQEAMASADEAVIVTTPDDVAMRDADRTAGLISQRGGARVRVVVNRVRGEYVKRGLQYPPEAVAATLDAKLLCSIPEDEEILRWTLSRRLPLTGAGEGIRALSHIAQAMCGKQTEAPARKGLLARWTR